MRMRKAIAAALAAAVALSGIAAAQQAPGTLRVGVTANGEAAGATVEVLPAGGGAALASGPGGQAFDLPAGAYDVRAVLTEAIDDPARTVSGVQIAAGAEKAIDVDFQVSRARLACRVDGETVSGTVRIRRPGSSNWLPEVPCGAPFIVSGGTYEAEVTLASGAVVAVPRLQLMAGATQRVPLDLE